MNARDLTAEEAIAECLAIADRCCGASGEGRYADGYRAAARDVRALIEARFGTRLVAAWERELRDVEIEARTLSRVVTILRREQASAASAQVRRTLAEIVRAIDEDAAESSVEVRDAG